MSTVRHWIFQANPKWYDLAKVVQTKKMGNVDDWAAIQYIHQMQAGDKVALWQSGKHAGVYAVGELLDAPRQREGHAEWQVAAGRVEEDPGFAVKFRLTALYPLGIPRSVIMTDIRLRELSILKMASGTNFKVTPQEWDALEDIIQKYQSEGTRSNMSSSSSYKLTDSDGQLLDAAFDIEDSMLILHSRGGTKGKNAQNPDYAKALNLLLSRLDSAGLRISRAWVDSSRGQALPINDRLILSDADTGLSLQETFTRMSLAMERIGRAPDARGHGNRTKRIRIQIESPPPLYELVSILGAVSISGNADSGQRLPASVLEQVTPVHIWNAVQRLRAGYTDHGFGPSTDYDILLEDGERFPPKAVFGVAASEALGFKVLPIHFSGGESSTSFRLLKQAGFIPVPKAGTIEILPLLPSPEDLEWTEGGKVLVTHLRSERSSGLAQAKKAAFKLQHGRLFCEKCRIDPVTAYGEHGEACIEVHHSRIQVKDMAGKHVTVLDDLQCLCANCHRVEHRRLRTEA
ncbi:EVE domain-containing protein [Deinococcus sonorensis]|uniref:EVE domain-containing protein n=2 Tax=Deinococcus sonorensis TaxID=309891 RepID=A0AAU7UF32_9DEIO